MERTSEDSERRMSILFYFHNTNCCFILCIGYLLQLQHPIDERQAKTTNDGWELGCCCPNNGWGWDDRMFFFIPLCFFSLYQFFYTMYRLFISTTTSHRRMTGKESERHMFFFIPFFSIVLIVVFYYV
jgi:hypothetical protein